MMVQDPWMGEMFSGFMQLPDGPMTLMRVVRKN